MGGCCRSLVLALACSALSLVARRAHASDALDVPAECGSRAELDDALRKRLGPDAAVSDVQVSITRGPTRFHLRVSTSDQLRELDDASCAALFRASVVIAVAMLLHEPLPPVEPTTPEPATPPPPPPPPPPTRSNPPRLTLGANLGGSIGTLPKPVPVVGLEAQVLWQYLGVSVDLRYYLPTQKLDAQGKGVEVSALGGAATGIFRPSRLWEARLGFAAQRLRGSGAGSITAKQSDAAWAAGPTLGLAFTPIQTRRLWAGLGAEGQLNAVRGSFEILNYSQNLESPAHVAYRVPGLAGAIFVRLSTVW